MTTTPTTRQLTAADADAQAFGLTAAFNRLQFVKDLVNDPATSVFSKDVVRWLVQALEDERGSGQSNAANLLQLRDEVARLKNRPADLPKSKAIVKLSKVIAKQAAAIIEVNYAIHHAGDGAPNESQAMDDLSDALAAWQKTHAGTIEAATYGD